MKPSLLLKKTMQQAGILLLLLSLALVSPACTHTDDETLETKSEWLTILQQDLDFSSAGGTKSIDLMLVQDLPIADLEYKVAENGEDWCTVEIEGNCLKITVDPTYYDYPRSTVVTVSYKNLKRELSISQAASEGAEDIKIKVTGATATSEENTASDQLGVVNAYDGDYLTYFNSKFGAITVWPFHLEFTLETPNTLDCLMYYPRADAGNRWGAFGEFEVWVSTVDNPDFVKIGRYDHGKSTQIPTRITLETAITNVKKVRFDVYTAYQDRVSCGEMEFIQYSLNKFNPRKIFTDNLCTELLPGITEQDIRKIPDPQYKQLATALLNNVYNFEYRVRDFRPYQNPSILAAENKTSPYSLRDNPSGIYVEAGDELLVLVGPTQGQNLSMVVQDLSVGYNSSRTYPLSEGANLIKAVNGGLIYILNLTNDAGVLLNPQTDAERTAIASKTVKVHFVFGKVNGYFDIQKHTAQDWTQMLRSAKYRDIDALGRYAHITWNADHFRQYNTDIVSELQKYDSLVYLQQEFEGLVKYNRVSPNTQNRMFQNRMYFHIDYTGASPYASANRTAYTPSYAEVFCNPARFGARLWGPAHEVGHMNQTRPGLKWAGTTEVTNNILSMYIQQKFREPSKLLSENQYALALAYMNGKPHCLDNASNEFIYKLVPFWQLKLYLVDALGQTDFYKDLYEYYRKNDGPATSVDTDGVLQLDFVRQVCSISGYNLLDFFTTWGFLTPVDKTINDYGNKSFRITATQIQNLRNEINGKSYATPHPDVHLITEGNLNNYRN